MSLHINSPHKRPHSLHWLGNSVKQVKRRWMHSWKEIRKITLWRHWTSQAQVILGWNSLTGQDCVFVCRWQKAEISSRPSMVILRTEHNVPSLHHSHSESYQFLTIHHTPYFLYFTILCSPLSVPLNALHTNSLFLARLLFALPPFLSHTDYFK